MNIWGCENFYIFLDNLSPYHVFFDFVAFVAFLATLWYCSKQVLPVKNASTEDNSEINEENEDMDADEAEITAATLRTHRQAKDLLSEISSNLSENELAEEQKVVKMQVEKIFELLREQEEKFNVTSMDQVQDQLSLYR